MDAPVPAYSAAASTAAPPRTILVLQGGGALGSYQAGAYEALLAREEEVDWVAGISIGAINAALIAGNPRERRLQRLRAFWQRVSLDVPPSLSLSHPGGGIDPGPLRGWWDQGMAMWGAWQGVPGFFRPRPPWDWWPRPPASLYDTEPLRQTLLELVDFDLLNDGPMRLSVGAVDVESGNFTYFDNRAERIGPEHIMASGALPPGFGAVQVGERWYWDGGIVSNTPLTHIVGHLPRDCHVAVTIFQIDLFSARGSLPGTLVEVVERQKDIQYSSRTRAVSDWVRERQALHQRLRDMAALLPAEQQRSAEVRRLLAQTEDPSVALVHVIHRGKPYESANKGYEFSRLSMTEHWAAGLADMGASLEMLRRQPALAQGEFRVFDYQPDAPQGARLQTSSSARG